MSMPRVSDVFASNTHTLIHFCRKNPNLDKSMKSTIHKWVLNAIAAPNPTPMSKLAKYICKKTKSTSFVYIGLYRISRIFCYWTWAITGGSCPAIGAAGIIWGMLMGMGAMGVRAISWSQNTKIPRSTAISTARAQEGINSKGNIIDI